MKSNSATRCETSQDRSDSRSSSKAGGAPTGSSFGALLIAARGSESRLSFARRLGLSYTFVTSMEAGTRHPSDPVLLEIARLLHLDSEELLLAAHCDRSPALTRALVHRGVRLPEGLASLGDVGAGPKYVVGGE